ncbi:MAG: peptidylprolyl isomerase [Brevinema sp.]
MRFIKNTILCAGILLIVSCGSNPKVVSYKDLSSKKVDVTLEQAMERVEYDFSGISPLEINALAADPELFKQIIASSILDTELYVMDAITVSNFTEDPMYIESIKQQDTILPYFLATEKGKQSITQLITKSKIDVAKVYQIVFTNNTEDAVAGDTNQMTPEQILEVLKSSTNVLEDFMLMAMQHSQDPLFAQTGGALGYVQKGSRSDLENVLFVEKVKGLYPKIIEGEVGRYIVYVEEKAKSISLEEAQANNIYVSTERIVSEHFEKNISLNFSLSEEGIKVGNKTYALAEFPTQTKIVTIYGKKYSFDDLVPVLQAQNIIPFGELPEFGAVIPGFLSPADPSKAGPLLYNAALTLKEFKPSIKNSKDFKKMRAYEQRAFEFQNAVPILSQLVFQDLSTNVTDTEALTAYNSLPREQRPIAGFNAKDEPIYSTFAQAKEEIKQRIVGERARVMQEAYRATLDEKYSVIWNEKGLEKLMEKIQKDYGAIEEVAAEYAEYTEEITE